MAKTVAELSREVDYLSSLLDVTRQHVAELRVANEALTERQHAAALESTRSREEQLHTRRQLDEARDLGRTLEKAISDLRQELAALRQDHAVARQQLQDHVAQYQEWDRRRWGLIVLLIGAVFSLASGLIVALTKK